MIRFKPLPQIALTNLQPAFYDVESVTAVEMVSKLYSYLQDLVNDYNAFVTEINNEINAFEDDINYKTDDFINCVKNLMDQYIQSIDIRISLQNKTIADAVDYMKENLENEVETLFTTALSNGDITANLLYNAYNESITLELRESE